MGAQGPATGSCAVRGFLRRGNTRAAPGHARARARAGTPGPADGTARHGRGAPPRSARAAGRNTPAPRRRSPASRSGSTAPFPSRAPAGVLFRASGRRVASPDNAGGSGRAGSSASARRSPAARDWAHGRDRPAADRYRNAAAPASVVPGRLRAGCAARATDANSRAAPPPAGRRSSPSHGTGKTRSPRAPATRPATRPGNARCRSAAPGESAR